MAAAHQPVRRRIVGIVKDQKNHGTYPCPVHDVGGRIELATELCDAVLESACAALAQLASDALFPDLAINLSVGQLADVGLVDRIGRTIAG